VGKFFGLAGTLVVNASFMALGVFAALYYVSHRFKISDGWVLVALYFIILQFLIITSLALLFSSFSSPLLSAVFAFALFIIGTFAEDLRGFAGLTKGVVRWLATGAAYLVPNFSALNVISSVAHEQPVSTQLILSNTLYAVVYASMALCGAVLIFERRNLK
jgi:ABC-type transport system involved in multi-copper enzyme maturation permease subunit